MEQSSNVQAQLYRIIVILSVNMKFSGADHWHVEKLLIVCGTVWGMFVVMSVKVNLWQEYVIQ